MEPESPEDEDPTPPEAVPCTLRFEVQTAPETAGADSIAFAKVGDRLATTEVGYVTEPSTALLFERLGRRHSTRPGCDAGGR